jgi:hypothetical protein
MIPAPKRRWFRFTLRTLFAVVTLFGVLAGYVIGQYNWYRERQSVFADPRMCTVAEPRPNVRAPGLLWMFGDLSWESVSLASHSKFPPATSEDLARTMRLFPEARVGSKLHGSKFDQTIEQVWGTSAISRTVQHTNPPLPGTELGR